MRLEVAKQLIEEGIEPTTTKQVWVDLGAGNGLFTRALSIFLPETSLIYAIDRNVADLDSIRIWQQVMLKKIHADFVHDLWTIEPLNGILMANAFHFVKEKESFLKGMSEKLAPDGRIIIVEYEMEHANQWVPYPIGFSQLQEMVLMAGFSSIKKLKEVPSVYDNRMIYSAVVQ